LSSWQRSSSNPVDRIVQALAILEHATACGRWRRKSSSSSMRLIAATRRDRRTVRHGARPDYGHQVEGDLRRPRRRDRPVRGRRQPARRRRRHARLTGWTPRSSPFGADCSRPRLRLHQRLSRRRQLDCHDRLDPGTHARQGGHQDGRLQLRRCVRVRHRGVDGFFRRVQLLTAAGFSLMHGRRCAGEWRGRSCGPGFSPSPRPRSSAP
jgi:hypothetical protein